MDIASSCPACGAQLQIASDAKKATCPFCGNRFDVDLSSVEPQFRVTSAANEMPDVPVPEPVRQPEPARTSPEPPEFPQYVPAQPRTEAPKPGGFFTSERIPPAIRRQPVWAIIAIIFAVVLCLAFGCMGSVFLLFRAIAGN